MISPRVILPAPQRVTFTLDDGRTFQGTWDGMFFIPHGAQDDDEIFDIYRVVGWLPDQTDRQAADALRRLFRGEAA